jgi:hypothetical protein
MLAKGNPAPTEKSRFKWCQDKLKAMPADKVIQALLREDKEFLFGQEYEALMLMGVRVDESTVRKASIQKFEESVDSRFAKHPMYPTIRTYHPIKFVRTDDAFALFYDYECLSWGVPTQDVLDMYQDDMMECQINPPRVSREILWWGSQWMLSCNVTGPKDKMFENLIAAGEHKMENLAECRKLKNNFD